MSQEETFLATILAEPDDPALRLVYADWLEERGDPRGEYLRIEDELSGESVFTPRHWDLQERRRALRESIDPAWLDRLGYGIVYRPMFTRLPGDRESRWRLVERFIELWHEPLTVGSGNRSEEIAAAEEQLGVRLPAALREWYQLAGNRTEIWSKQDGLYKLSGLRIDEEDGGLIFRCENQGCVVWGISTSDLELADPPVHVHRDCTGIDSPTVTSFAIQTLLMETIWPAAVGGYSEDAVLNEEIRRAFVQCDLPQRYWVMDPVVFYEGTDIFFVDSHNNDFLWLAARNEAALDQLTPRFRESLVWHRP